MDQRRVPPHPETIAGRYRVEREIGRGGMGSVWLARDQRLGRDVAIKQVGLLPGESMPDLARAMREARSTAALNHRNVVAVYDAIEEGDHIWMVMEYVNGRTLSQIVAQEGPLDPQRAAWIGAQVADGLAAAHAAGTVHRDVKPGNVLVTADDQAMISDFGIARTQGDDKLTQTGLMTGTPAYFSPELARGADASTASDVWALGATLYAAVEGASPYPSQANALALLARIASDEPPRPRQAGPLTNPITRMMDPDVDRRWSMADAAHALHRIHAPVVDAAAEHTTVFEGPTVAREVAPVAAVPLVQEEDRSSRRGGLLLAGLLAALLVVGGLAYLLLQGQDDDDPGTASGDSSPSASATDETTDNQGDEQPRDETTAEEPPEGTTTEPEPEPEPEPKPEPEPTTSSSAPAAGAGSAAGFIEDYYSFLPTDTEASWSMLSPAYQSQTSYGRYSGFWRTIDSVTVDATEEVDADTVLVTLTYNGNDTEVREIDVEPSGDGFVIVDDALSEG